MKGSSPAFPRLCWILTVHLKRTTQGDVNLVCTTNSHPRTGTLEPRRGRGTSRSGEAAAPPVTEHTVFLKVNLLFASAGNGPFVRWQGCEPCDTGGKSNTTARAPAPVPAVWGQQHSARLLVTHCAGGNKPSPDLTPHTIRCSQTHLEPTALVQTHGRAPSVVARGQVFYTCSPRSFVWLISINWLPLLVK